MQTVGPQSVNEENFWQQRTAFERSAFKQAWHDLKWRCGTSLALSIIYRAIICGLVIPCSKVGALIVASAIESGWIETLNALFIGHTEPFSAEGIKMFLSAWVVLSTLEFGIGWALVPWKSPAARQLEREMERWW